MPAFIQNKPELPEDLICYWQAYEHLTRSRIIHFGGAGPIPISEISAYCEMMNIHSGEDVEEMLLFIQAMDGAFLEHQQKKGGE